MPVGERFSNTILSMVQYEVLSADLVIQKTHNTSEVVWQRREGTCGG
jgi:hypothetical protein